MPLTHNTYKSIIFSATLHLSIMMVAYLLLPSAKQITQKTTVFLSTANQNEPSHTSTNEPSKAQNKQNDKNTKKQIAEQKNENIPLKQDIAKQNAEPDTKIAAAAPQTHNDTTAPKETKQAETKITKPVFNAAYLKNPPPRYPTASERRGEEGVVLIRALIGVDGSCKKATLKQSSGYTRLDDSALEAVQSWRFIPAKKGDEPIEDWVQIPLEFKR